ncbi:TetR/AcrR family transcriptional regulator [Pontibacter brevis]
MKKTQEKREKSKRLLADTALKLFSEKGFAATSIRNIASEAGVSLGLMYNYFTSKEELLQEIFLLGNNDIIASFAPATAAPGVSSLKQHILQTVQKLKDKRDFWRLLHSLRFQGQVLLPLRQEIEDQQQYIVTQLQNNLREAGVPFPDLEAKLLFASIDGMAAHYLLNRHYPIDEVAHLLISKYTTS